MRISDWSSDVCSSDLARAVAPQRQQVADRLHREAEAARALDEAQRLDIVAPVDAVAGRGALGGSDEADGFVVADGLGRHAGLASRGADVHGAASDKLSKMGRSGPHEIRRASCRERVGQYV